MSLCNDYCDFMLDILKPLSSEMKVVLAHESCIKSVPVNEIIAAVGVKKCIVSRVPEEKTDDNVKIQKRDRCATVTVGVNLYVPYSNGTRGCTDAFDAVFDCIISKCAGYLCEARLLGTKYSREAQSLITETEFVFENGLSPIVEGPPLVIG